MPTSVPNFSFLAPLVLEMWRGSQNKKWELLISQIPPSGQIFTWSYSTRKCLPAYQILTSYLCWISFWDRYPKI